MRSLAAALAALVVLAAPSARAQPVSGAPGPATYLDLHLGAFVPQHDDLDALDPGYAFGGTVGARLRPNVGVEGELGYVRAEGSSVLGAARVDQTLAMVPFAASVRLVLPVRAVELSALAGGDLAIAWLETRARPGALQPSRTSDTSTVFGFHVGGAMAVQLSPTLLVGLDVRRNFASGRFDGIDVGLDGLRLALTLGYRL